MLTAAFLDAVVRHGDVLRIEGHLRPKDIRLDKAPAEALVVSIGPNSFAATWVVRTDRAVKNGLWCGFVVDVPLRSWPIGVHPVSVAIGTSTLVPARKSRSLWRNHRLTVADDLAFDVRATAKKQVLVECRTGGAAAGRRLRRRDDLRAILRRKPLWQWRLIRLLTWWYERRTIWLLGERHDTAQDNGAALFGHLRRERPRLEAYYIVRRGSAGWDKLKPLGHVIAHGSFRHKLLLAHADFLINAFDTDVYGVPEAWKRDDYIEHLRPRVGTKRVFLQHGVIYRDLSSILHRLSTGYDLIVSSAEAERAWLASRFDFGERAALTGLARHDTLVPRREPGTILFAPTWRADLVVPSYREGTSAGLLPGFEDSGYFSFMAGVLNHPRLRAALVQHDHRLAVLPHYELRVGFEKVATPDERLYYLNQATIDFQAELTRASIFVTDYSSTLFDLALLGTPQVTAHFDPEFEAAGSPQAFDLRQMGFGPVTETIEDTVDAIISYIESGAVREDVYDRRTGAFFAFGDQRNCARIVSAIEAL